MFMSIHGVRSRLHCIDTYDDDCNKNCTNCNVHSIQFVKKALHKQCWETKLCTVYRHCNISCTVCTNYCRNTVQCTVLKTPKMKQYMRELRILGQGTKVKKIKREAILGRQRGGKEDREVEGKREG